MFSPKRSYSRITIDPAMAARSALRRNPTPKVSSAANPNRPTSVVADLVKHHVVTLKDVIDAQASKDPARAYTSLRAAAGHMQMIADPLAEAIVKQFPDKFAG